MKQVRKREREHRSEGTSRTRYSVSVHQLNKYSLNKYKLSVEANQVRKTERERERTPVEELPVNDILRLSTNYKRPGKGLKISPFHIFQTKIFIFEYFPNISSEINSTHPYPITRFGSLWFATNPTHRFVWFRGRWSRPCAAFPVDTFAAPSRSCENSNLSKLPPGKKLCVTAL